ncbi:MAG: glycosyltransferase family 2 protein [Sphingobacteriales bacterium]|nr:glycosyltransferase family 2 protein [Sphingobacteriales bacterium]
MGSYSAILSNFTVIGNPAIIVREIGIYIYKIMKPLTLVITTYNRKQPLLTMLKSIERQGQIKEYNLIISNNNSNYNVEEWVKQNVSKSFFDNIQFYNRAHNIGGDLNIAFSFQLCKTKWMWLLSDDDYITLGAINIVLNDIMKYSEISMLKYSIDGNLPYLESFVNSLDLFFDYYIEHKYSAGEMIFMSNNVFNLDALGKYLGFAPMAAHTYMSQLVPTLFALIKDNALVAFRPNPIIHYHFSGSSYNSSKAEAGFANIITFLDLNKSQASKIRKLFRKNNQFPILLFVQKEENKYIKRLLYWRIFNSYYSFFNLRDLFYFIVFYVCDVFSIKLENIQTLYHRFKKINENTSYTSRA